MNERHRKRGAVFHRFLHKNFKIMPLISGGKSDMIHALF
jgi:hypothetical protein